MEIKGHSLPKRLQELLHSQKWSQDADQTKLKKLIGAQSKLDFTLLSFEGMKRESNLSHLVDDAKMAEIYGLASSKKSGHPIHDVELLDVEKTVLIAVNYDEEAIALDYRESSNAPRVLAGLVSDTTPTRWQIVAPNFDLFAEQIGF